MIASEKHHDEPANLLRCEVDALSEHVLNHCNNVIKEIHRFNLRYPTHGDDRMRGLYRNPAYVGKLSEGEPGDSSRCVIAQTIANATGCQVKVGDRTEIWMAGAPLVFDHSEEVNEFIGAFDSRRIPSLDASVQRAKRMAAQRNKLAPQRVDPEMVWVMDELEPIEPPKEKAPTKCDSYAHPDWQSLILPTEEVRSEGMAETKTPQPA